jgi:hypothetical protein
MTSLQLHPERLAELEAGGWRAYYDRDWPRLVRLMVQLAVDRAIALAQLFFEFRPLRFWILRRPAGNQVDRVIGAHAPLGGLPHAVSG